MSKIQIIGAPQSPFVWATRMAGAEKGLDVELVPAGPHTPEIYAINPFGKIPVMRHGDLALSQSRAIALYFDSLTPRNPLFPRDPIAAARAEQWIMHLYTEFTPALLGGYIAHYFFPRGADGKPDRQAIAAGLTRMQKALETLDAQLADNNFVAGDFTFADPLFAPQLHYLSVLPEGAAALAASKKLSAYLARVSERASFKATFPPPMPGAAPA